MKRLKASGLGFVASAAVVLAVATGLLATQVSAQDETVSIGSATVATEGQGSVDLAALNIADPGLGAWTVDITYDPDVVSVASCLAQSGGVCNPAYEDDTIRVTGASGTGLEGDTTLATITFECGADEDTSALVLSLEVLADATPADPQDIDAETQTGSVTCLVRVPGQGETVSIGSATAVPGGQASVDLEALNMTEPGLGAWTVDITYDPAVVTAVDCDLQQGGVCNPFFEDDTIRVTGANAGGLEGDITLATITFRCGDSEGSSDLDLTVQVLVDATVGSPKTIDADVGSGSVTCAEATPTSTAGPTTTPVQPAATATPTSSAAGVPVAGTGGGWDDGSGRGLLIAGLVGAGLAWLIAGLAGAGLATVGGSGAARPRVTQGPGEATAIPTSGSTGQREAGTGGASSEGGGARNWLSAAREELASAGLAGIAGFRSLRRRPDGRP